LVAAAGFGLWRITVALWKNTLKKRSNSHDETAWNLPLGIASQQIRGFCNIPFEERLRGEERHQASDSK
jgi:hypothetical protein